MLRHATRGEIVSFFWKVDFGWNYAEFSFKKEQSVLFKQIIFKPKSSFLECARYVT